jgi:hypothetical protein
MMVLVAIEEVAAEAMVHAVEYTAPPNLFYDCI